MRTSNITTDNNFMGYPIKTNPLKGEACHKEILNKIRLLMDYGLTKGPILSYRFDLRYPTGFTYPQDNFYITKFMAYFINRLKDKYKYSHPLYLWVREGSNEVFMNSYTSFESIHYHVLMIVQKRVCQNEYGHLSLADSIWQMKLGLTPKKESGLLHRCDAKGNGVIISKSDPNFHLVYANSYNRFSYLSKVKSKGYAPIHIKEYGSSELPLDFQLKFNLNQEIQNISFY